MFCCLLIPRADVALAVARACSPRVRVYTSGAVFDVSGCSRTIGPPHTIAREVSELAKWWLASPKPRSGEGGSEGLPRVCVAPTVTMAWLLAHACSDVTVVQSTPDKVLLSRLPVSWLGAL